ILRRPAISFSALATSSACALLSSWHGPAIIEIGKSLPNLTDPTVTTGEAKRVASTAISLSGATLRSTPDGSIEIARGNAGMHPHLTEENAVGTRSWLTILPTIWPSASVLARAAIQSGSVWNAAHFFSRSASDSQAR